MTQGDATHFGQYLEQTRTKHEILRSYIKPFFAILKERHKNILFVDGFAGRGAYMDGDSVVPGSPLIAIEVISSTPELAEKVQPVFIEANQDYFAELEKAVVKHRKKYPTEKEPQLLQGDCASVLKDLAETENLAPTFLFVDPCGVRGVNLPLICKILNQPRCELFLFLNYSGLVRITGLASKKGSSETLVELLGADEATIVGKAFSTAANERERENVLIEAVLRILRDAGGAEFVLPFRVEDRNSRRTSHYLIHATKHKLGFKIMKDVMFEAGRLEHEGVGRLERLQASLKSGKLLLVRQDLDDVEETIIDELRTSPRTVGHFTEDLVVRPDDFVASSAYRHLLLKLEAEGRIEVLKADGTPAPAAKRRPYKGKPSLPPHLKVRLRRSASR